MAFTYCRSCGYKNMYSLTVPKFCGGCGSELSELSDSKASVLKKPQKEKENMEDFDPDGLDIFSIPKITKLSYSIEHSPSNKMNLEDLVPLEALEEFDEELNGGEKTKKS